MTTAGRRPGIAALLPAFLLFALCACGVATPEGSPREERRRRIVVMAPAAAGMIEALGAIDQVVGVGDFVTEPDAVADLPRVGAYDRPNTEQVLALRADLFVTANSDAAHDAHRRLESLGVRVLPLETDTFEGIFRSLGQVGLALERQERAKELARSMRENLQGIERRAAGATPRSVLFVVGRDPLYVAGSGSHADEMIAMVGGSNAARDSERPYLQLSMEAVLEWMPEVIVDTSDNRPGALRGRRAGSWGRWGFLPAVRHDRVYHVDPGLLSIPGVRLPEMTLLMGRLVQPELFGEITDEELRVTATAGDDG